MESDGAGEEPQPPQADQLALKLQELRRKECELYVLREEVYDLIGQKNAPLIES